MASNNLFPDIQFEEIIDDQRPVAVGSINRIGIVGTFRKGPYNTFRLVSSYEQFRLLYGATTHQGSVGVQVAMEQGADDFGIIRVMGRAKRATSTMTFAVPGPLVAGNLDIIVTQFDTDNTTVLHTTTATLAVTGTMTATQIANAAVALINSTPVMQDDVQAVYDTGGQIIVQARTAGNLGNYIKIDTDIPGVGGVSGVTASPNTATNLSGGVDGPATSFLVIQDTVPADNLRVEAAFPGLAGDDIVITTAPGSASGLFNLQAKDTVTGDTETYFDLSFAADQLDPDTNELVALRASNLIRAYFLGSDPAVTPAIVTLAPLANGSDGPAIEDQDYLDALKIMENRVVNYILAPGQTSPSIRSALIAQAENSGPMNGFRIAILNANKAMPIETLSSVTQALNSNSGSAVLVAGWGTYAGQPRFGRFKASPDAAYAGHLAVTPSQVSPAARSSSPFIRGFTEVDTITSEQAFNEYTKARMEAIIVDPATGGFHCLNGRTLSSDGAWYWVSVRRVFNQIKSDLFRMIQWVKSQPNTTVLRNQLASQLDTYMDYLLNRGIIANTQRSVVNSSNNPPARVASGYLRAEVYFVPIFPADHVVIGVHRYLAADAVTQVGA